MRDADAAGAEPRPSRPARRTRVIAAAPLTWAIAAVATAGVIVRPWKLPEPVWAVAGAALIVVLGLLPVRAAWQGVLQGQDVYLFLTGMMLLSEVARRFGLFDWVAAYAVARAAGSPTRLLALIFGVGVVVTAFLSNDATAVVLTPAVAAAVRAARGRHPLPYLLACALVANAAGFVLPISNPANLVIYGSRMPPLLDWLPRYAWPSLAAIAATYAGLRLTQRGALRQAIAADVERRHLATEGRIAALGIAATAVALLAASAFGVRLGLATFVCGAATALVVLLREPAPLRTSRAVVRGIAWGVLPLVAGLFVLVQALAQTGVIEALAALLSRATQTSPVATAWGAGSLLAVACNLMNNLPAGLIAGHAVQAAQVPRVVNSALLIGVDIGPNLSVTGSLATILWLGVLRREGLACGAWDFLKVGAVVMPPALLLALAALVLAG